MEQVKIEVPFDFKKHFSEFREKLKEEKECLNKFNEEYAIKAQNHQDSVLFAYMQSLNEHFNALHEKLEKIDIFFNGNFNHKELANLNQFLSTNATLKDINENLTNLLNTTKKLEEEKLSESIEEIISLKSQFINRLASEVKTMDNLLKDFINKKIKDFEENMKTGFDNQINALSNNFDKSYNDTIEKLNHLSTTTQDKITILKKNVKINYIFYSINGLLIFLLMFSSYFLFNAYRDYQNKSKALVNIATKLEGQISINAQGQVTLSLAKLKTIFKEDKNSIYLTIKEE